MMSTTITTETDLIEAVDRIVFEIERALLEDEHALAGDLHAVLTSGGETGEERQDQVMQIAWQLSTEDHVLRRAS
jgi:hypothetical protein